MSRVQSVLPEQLPEQQRGSNVLGWKLMVMQWLWRAQCWCGATGVSSKQSLELRQRLDLILDQGQRQQLGLFGASLLGAVMGREEWIQRSPPDRAGEEQGRVEDG